MNHGREGIARRPSYQQYPRDWLTCPELRRCSVGARGLWQDMLSLAHFGEPYGHLRSGGRAYSTEEIARLTGVPTSLTRKLLAELERNEVFSRTDDAERTIYSRRMVRDGEAVERRKIGGELGAEHGHKGAEHGSKGGRPPKEKGSEKPPSKPPSGAAEKPPSDPPPSSASASASAEGSPLRESSRAREGPDQPAAKPPKATKRPLPIDPATVPLPPPFDTPEIREALGLWCVRRLEEGNGEVRPAGLKLALGKLRGLTPERALAVIMVSAEGGHQGIDPAWLEEREAKRDAIRMGRPNGKPFQHAFEKTGDSIDAFFGKVGERARTVDVEVQKPRELSA